MNGSPDRLAWSDVQLYIVMIGHKDRDKKQIPQERFDSLLYGFQEALLERLEGSAAVKDQVAQGKTRTWAREDASLVFIVADDQKAAEEALEGQCSHGGTLAEFEQDEIWYLRQTVAIHKARFERRDQAGV